jgi:excisionase family DNA binding protein
MDERLEVYSVKEVAAILKTSRQQVRKMIQNEELPAVKVGREWRITGEAIETLVNDPIE